MARVYLETSLISACVSTKTDLASLYQRKSSLEWLEVQGPLHQLYISAEVTDELDSPSYPRRHEAMDLCARFGLLAVNDDVVGLAKVLVRERVMPGPVAGDAVHVAAACVHRMNYLLSWNVRHLANRNKVAHLQVVCLRLGYMPPLILTPELLWERSP